MMGLFCHVPVLLFTFFNVLASLDCGDHLDGFEFDPVRDEWYESTSPYMELQERSRNLIHSGPWWKSLKVQCDACVRTVCGSVFKDDCTECTSCCVWIEQDLHDFAQVFDEQCTEAGGKTVLNNITMSCMEGTRGCRNSQNVCLSVDLIGYPTCVDKNCTTTQAHLAALIQVFGYSYHPCHVDELWNNHTVHANHCSYGELSLSTLQPAISTTTVPTTESSLSGDAMQQPSSSCVLMMRYLLVVTLGWWQYR